MALQPSFLRENLPLRSLLFAAAIAAVSALSTAATAAPIGIVAAENFYGELAREIGGTHVTVAAILSNRSFATFATLAS